MFIAFIDSTGPPLRKLYQPISASVSDRSCTCNVLHYLQSRCCYIWLNWIAPIIHSRANASVELSATKFLSARSLLSGSPGLLWEWVLLPCLLLMIVNANDCKFLCHLLHTWYFFANKPSPPIQTIEDFLWMNDLYLCSEIVGVWPC